MQQDVLVQGLGHRATACCTSPCARDGPLCNRPVQHPCARGDPLCNTLVHHTIPVQEAALCAMDLCTTACARGHACAQLLVQEESQCATALHNTRAPPLVQEEPPRANALHTTPRAPPLVQEKPHVQMPCTPPLVQRPCTPPRVQHPVCTTPRARETPRANALHTTPRAPQAAVVQGAQPCEAVVQRRRATPPPNGWKGDGGGGGCAGKANPTH